MSDGRAPLRSLYDVHGEKLRYLISGAWNTAFGYGLFVGALYVLRPVLAPIAQSSTPWLALLGENYYLLVSWLSWILAVVQSTAVMKYLVFRKPGHLWKQVGKAYLVYLPAQALSSLILWIMVEVAGTRPELGQLVAVFVTVIFSYFGHKYFTFSTPGDPLSHR